MFLPPLPSVWEFSIKIVTTIGTFKKEKSLTPKKKINDLVFVMYNLKIKEKRAKPLSTKEEIGLENLSSNDEWLAADSVDSEDDNADFDEDNEGINL